MDNKENDNKNEIEVIIGDNSDLTFSEVEDLVQELKPKVTKKSNIIIPGSKKKTNKKENSDKKSE